MDGLTIGLIEEAKKAARRDVIRLALLQSRVSTNTAQAIAHVINQQPKDALACLTAVTDANDLIYALLDGWLKADEDKDA